MLGYGWEFASNISALVDRTGTRVQSLSALVDRTGTRFQSLIWIKLELETMDSSFNSTH